MILPGKREDWPAEWLELWNERAAILEFEAHFDRDYAERIAEEDTRNTAARNHQEVAKA